MIADSMAFSPRFVALKDEEAHNEAANAMKSHSLMQAFQNAAFGGANCFVWEKTLGVSGTYFSQSPVPFYESISKIEPEANRSFQVLLQPSRPVKFFGYLQLSALSPESRLLHVQKLQGLVAHLWNLRAPGKKIDRGWRVLATDDQSRVLIVNMCIQFSEIRNLNQFLNLLHNDFLYSPSMSQHTRLPFFKKILAKEGAKIPIAYCAIGNAVFRPLEVAADPKSYFLDCLPHYFGNYGNLECHCGEEKFLVMPVEDRQRLFSDMFSLLRRDGYVLPQTDEIVSTIIPIAQYSPKH